jgi:hypothetical protein
MMKKFASFLTYVISLFLLSSLPAAAGYCEDYEASKEYQLSDIPPAWPSEFPAPQALSKIGGLLSVNEGRNCHIDLYGRTKESGKDYLQDYQHRLEQAGFRAANMYESGDLISKQFEHEDGHLVRISTSIVNARTKSEYTEIGAYLILNLNAD